MAKLLLPHSSLRKHDPVGLDQAPSEHVDVTDPVKPAVHDAVQLAPLALELPQFHGVWFAIDELGLPVHAAANSSKQHAAVRNAPTSIVGASLAWTCTLPACSCTSPRGEQPPAGNEKTPKLHVDHTLPVKPGLQDAVQLVPLAMLAQAHGD